MSGTTSLYVTDANNNQIASYTINVNPDLSRLKRMIRMVAPGNRIRVQAVGNTIMLRGMVRSAETANRIVKLTQAQVSSQSAQKSDTKDSKASVVIENNDKKSDSKSDKISIINFMKVAEPSQVNLRVQIVEMTREVARDIGVNWNFKYAGKKASALLGYGYLPPGVNPAAFSNNFTVDSGRFAQTQATLSLLEQRGLVTILSEPNLTALSGKTASFLAGGEFPILVPQNNNNVTVEFKNFGVSLSFTPTVLPSGLINLKIRPEVSELSDKGAVTLNNFTIPALVTRRAETTVELRSGQSFVIAGLLQNNANKEVQRFPGLAKLPILGHLFRSESFVRGETELVIIVSPFIVRPVGANQLSVPTQELPIKQASRPKPAVIHKPSFMID